MKKTREYVQDLLNQILVNYHTDDDIKKSVIEQLRENGFMPGEVMRILNRILSVELLNDTDLYLIINALFNATQNDMLNPELYFNDREIAEAKQFRKEKKELPKELVFKYVTVNGTRQWMCPYVSYGHIKEIFDNRMFVYNFETQRDAIIKYSKGKIFRVPRIFEDKVSEIFEKQSNNKFTNNMIIINIRKTGEEEFKYDEETMTLRIPKIDSNFVDIIDGANRLYATMRLMNEYPNNEDLAKRGFAFSILNYDIDDAQGVIWQELQSAPVKEERKQSYNRDSVGVQVAKEVMSISSRNELFNKIAVDNFEIVKEGKYTSLATLGMAIDNNFMFDKKQLYPKKITDMAKFIVSGINEILGYFRDYIGNLDSKTNKQKYVILEDRMFIGYIAILAEIYGKSEWEVILQNTLKNIDFNRDNLLWQRLNIESHNVLKPAAVKKISESFVIAVRKGAEMNEEETRKTTETAITI
jgi:hypothetical protein